MKVDKSALKKTIDKAKPDEILLLSFVSLEKDSVSTKWKLVENFIKKDQDYVITVIKK
jgi:hypothetical protein